VTVSAVIQTGGGDLSGATATTDGQGRAQFSGLTITGDPGTRTLAFAASGFTSVTSNAIEVAAAPPDATQSSVTADPSTVQAGIPSTITATVRDARGIPLGGRTVTLQVTGSDNSIDPASAVTGSNGIATFTLTSSAVETKTITATADGVSFGSAAVTVEAVPTTTSITGASPPSGSQAGTPVTVSYEVTAVRGTATGTVSVTTSPPGSSCSDTVEARQCTLGALSPGTYTLTADYVPSGSFASSSGTAAYEVVTGR
jgi:hypothetical protein